MNQHTETAVGRVLAVGENAPTHVPHDVGVCLLDIPCFSEFEKLRSVAASHGHRLREPAIHGASPELLADSSRQQSIVADQRATAQIGVMSPAERDSERAPLQSRCLF